jgi:hypothetical protein
MVVIIALAAWKRLPRHGEGSIGHHGSMSADGSLSERLAERLRVDGRPPEFIELPVSPVPEREPAAESALTTLGELSGC